MKNDETVLGPLQFGREHLLSGEEAQIVEDLRRAMERYHIDPPLEDEQVRRLARAMREYHARMPDLLRPLPLRCFDEDYPVAFRPRRYLAGRTFEQEYLGIFVGDEKGGEP